MKKRILALLLSLMMLMQINSVFAYEKQEYSKDDIKIGLLTELGIINPDKLPAKEREITRGEFASYVSKLLNGTIMPDAASKFWDISEDYEHKEAINILTSLGCIEGHDDGSFAPNEPVTAGAAVKILVCLLGYASYSEIIGGFHNGYMEVARMIGLIPSDFAGAASPLDTNSFITLFYNALNGAVAKVEDLRADGSGNIEIKLSNKEHETVLEKYFDIKYVEGVIEANAYTSLYKNGSASYKAVSIDGTDYTCGREYDKYLGFRVACFYEEKENDVQKTVRFMHPTEKTVTYTIEPDDDPLLSGTAISYYEGNSRREKRLDGSDLSVLYNGRPIDYVTEFNNSLFNFSDGSILMIDNDDDGAVEVIRVTEYDSMVVSAVDEVDFKIYDKAVGAAFLDIDENEYYSITDTLGNSLDISQIKADSVISFAKSNDNKVCEIIVSYNYAEGNIESLTQDGDYIKLYIDGVEYKAITSELSSVTLSPSREYTFYINASGYVIAAEEAMSSSLSLGYLIKIIEDTATDETFARIMNAKNETTSIKFGEKTKIDGKSIKRENVRAYFESNLPVKPGEEYIKEIIRYSVFDDGTLKELDTSVYDGAYESEDTLRARYSGNFLQWQGGTSTLRRFYIGSDWISGRGNTSGYLTKNTGFMYGYTSELFTVTEPALQEGDFEIKLDDVSISSAPSVPAHSSLSVKTYSINTNTPILCGIIIKNGTAVAEMSKEFYIVTEKATALDKDNEARQYISISNGTTEMKLFVSDDFSAVDSTHNAETGELTAFDQINVGDAIRYTTDSKGYIKACAKIFDYNTKTVKSHVAYLQSDPRITGGIIYDMNGIFARVLSIIKDRNGDIHRIDAANVDWAVDEQLYILNQDYTNPGNGKVSLMDRPPVQSDAIDALAELVYLNSVSCYEVVRGKVVFSTLSSSEILDYVHAGSDCSTILLSTVKGNLPVKTAIIVK